MAAPAFDERMAELAESVGEGVLRGSVEVDQVYARYQHEGLDLRHPQGGQAKYLESPLYEKHRDYYQRLAEHVLDGGLSQAMIENVESLSLEVYDKAPFEFGDLKASGHPTVTRDGAILYDRAPMQARLTDQQLRAKHKLRRLGEGDLYDG